MKIAVITDRFPVLTEPFIVNQINGLVGSGNDVDVFAYNKGNQDLDDLNLISKEFLQRVQFKETMPSFKTLRFLKFVRLLIRDFKELDWFQLLGSLNFFKFGKRALSLEIFFQSYWFLKTKKYDIVHAHFGHIGASISKIKKNGFLSDSALIVTLHGYYIDRTFLIKNIDSVDFLFQQANRIIVNSKYSHNLIKEFFPLLEKIEILPVGLDTSYFKRNNSIKKDVFTIVFCGRLVPLKAPDLAIKIFQDLISEGIDDIILKIIGDGIMKNFLINMIDQQGLNSKIKILGFKNQEEVKEAMKEASLFLFPGVQLYGKAETQGLVIQEAQSMNLPVIVSDAGGMKYGLLNNKSGYVIKENDIKGFSRAVKYLYENENLRIQMGEIGRNYVIRNYDYKVINKQLIEIYKSSLKHKMQ